MKTTNKLFALAFMALAMVFASCSKDNGDVPTQKEIETKIIGKWKNLSIGENLTLTNKRTVMTYGSNGKGALSFSAHLSGGAADWVIKHPFTYSINGNTIKAGDEAEIKVLSISDETMLTTNGQDTPGVASTAAYTHVTADYTQDIIGLWEGVEVTGDVTYGGAEARIEFHADSTYTYYLKEADAWVPSTNVKNEYFIDGDWLAIRWLTESGHDFIYECWDIDYVKDVTMRWSAFREKEDGKRFTTTFTWKKVE